MKRAGRFLTGRPRRFRHRGDKFLPAGDNGCLAQALHQYRARQDVPSRANDHVLIRYYTDTLKLGLRFNARLSAMKLFILSALFASILSSPAVAGFKEGVAAYEAGNIPLAVKEFRASAEKGHADSQFNLALMYERGIGVSKDEKEALAWYRKAALQGNSLAQFNLAVLYENGRGNDVDFAQAHQWYRKAAAQGDALAVGNLGMLYLRGQGVKQEKVAGLALLLLSVTMDNSPENHAKQNISKTQGLTRDVIAAAQSLASEMGKAGNLLMPFDRYLKNSTTNTADKPSGK